MENRGPPATISKTYMQDPTETPQICTGTGEKVPSAERYVRLKNRGINPGSSTVKS